MLTGMRAQIVAVIAAIKSPSNDDLNENLLCACVV